MVLASLRAETELPVQMAPLIFVSTVVTHFAAAAPAERALHCSWAAAWAA